MKVTRKSKELPLIAPGQILEEEFMEPLGLTAYRVAKELSVAPIAISQIVRGKRAITAEMALRLGEYFGNTPQFWLNLQSNYELRRLQREAKFLKKLVKIKRCEALAA
jgi:addiction module HigA family antidote